jgi:hypothetical protein
LYEYFHYNIFIAPTTPIEGESCGQKFDAINDETRYGNRSTAHAHPSRMRRGYTDLRLKRSLSKTTFQIRNTIG